MDHEAGTAVARAPLLEGVSGIRRRVVTGRLRPATPFALASLVDFELGPEEAANLGEFAGRVAPWGLDLASGSVILLDFHDADALRGAVFVYQAQAAQATNVLLVPYAEFCALFGAVGGGEAARPPVFLHSVGRCGSTLLAHRLAALPGVCCLSEPDIYTAIQAAVEDGVLAAPLATELLRAATNLLTAALAGEDTLVVKTRSAVCRIWPLFDAAHRDARSLFLYRDAALVVQSFDRIFGYPHGRTQALPERDALLDRQLPAYEAAIRTRFFARGSPHVALAQRECGPWAGLFLAEWLDKVAAYVDARSRATDRVFGLRYADLVAHPEAVLADVARFLGHDAPGGLSLPTADSQAGTDLEAVETLLHPLDADTLRGIERAGRAVLGEGFRGRLPGVWGPI